MAGCDWPVGHSLWTLVLQFIWEIFFGLISHLFRPLETEKFISISKAQETLCSELLPSFKTHALPSSKLSFVGIQCPMCSLPRSLLLAYKFAKHFISHSNKGKLHFFVVVGNLKTEM